MVLTRHANRSSHRGDGPVRTADGIVHWEHPRYWFAVCDSAMTKEYMWQEGSEGQSLDTPVTCLGCIVALNAPMWLLTHF